MREQTTIDTRLLVTRAIEWILAFYKSIDPSITLELMQLQMQCSNLGGCSAGTLPTH